MPELRRCTFRKLEDRKGAGSCSQPPLSALATLSRRCASLMLSARAWRHIRNRQRRAGCRRSRRCWSSCRADTWTVRSGCGSAGCLRLTALSREKRFLGSAGACGAASCCAASCWGCAPSCWGSASELSIRKLAGVASTWSHSRTSARSTTGGLREGKQVTAVSQTNAWKETGSTSACH